jgi:hypothetical protein
LERAKRTARHIASAAVLAGMAAVTACSASPDSQPSMPSSIVVFFKPGIPVSQARQMAMKCHPLKIYGSDAARASRHRETSLLIWGPDAGTARASALFRCLKAIPDVLAQSWSN